MAAMTHAMCRELQLTDHVRDEVIHTVYLGGGTPSLLDPDNLRLLFDFIRSERNIAHDAEVTLEANPDDFSPERLELWRSVGINRLSIGIQSFHQHLLDWMNRAHDAEQAQRCISMANESGFDNLTIDIIFGVPAQTDAQLISDLDTAIGLGVKHLSCYGLTVEQRTPLANMIRKGQQQPVSEDDSNRQFHLVMQHLSAAGYSQYEISNYAIPGFESRHNSAYWTGDEYLGIGPSAHSFNGSHRWWNVRSNAAYIKAIGEGRVPSEGETLSTIDLLNEAIMLGLRTRDGINLERIDRIHEDASAELEKTAAPFIDAGQFEQVGRSLRLTIKGRSVADRLASELFFS
jgi:oxygen-independent coproporphyrinogen-3 oxidase